MAPTLSPEKLTPRLLKELLSYRQPLGVREILVYRSGQAYPVCPRCRSSLDREYMRFCDRCGQRLNWAHLRTAAVSRAC